MALSVKVGSFIMPTATGSQAVTGVGFCPKALIFFGSNTPADTKILESQACVGIATGASEERVMGHASRNAVGTTVNRQWRSDEDCILLLDPGGGAAEREADLTSLDADGFTLNWTAVTAVAGEQMNYLALGGNDLTHMLASEGASPTVTGNKSFTGFGFQPDAILILANGQVSAVGKADTSNSFFSLGAASAVNAEWASGSEDRSGQATSQSTRQQKSAVAGVIADVADFISAQLVSFDSDGFTLNFTNVVGNASDFMVLALKGCTIKAGGETTATSAGTKATTGVGFQPAALLISDNGPIALDTVENDMMAGVGASDGTTERHVANTCENGVPTSNTNRWQDNDVCLALYNPNLETVLDEAKVDSFDADGFTLDYLTADATARHFGWLAFAATVDVKKVPGIVKHHLLRQNHF